MELPVEALLDDVLRGEVVPKALTVEAPDAKEVRPTVVVKIPDEVEL